MKKTFRLEHPKKAYPRMIEAAKHEIRKYVKRERRRELPKGVDFWDFACCFGKTEATAKSLHLKEITAAIDAVAAAGDPAFYVEIVAQPGVRTRAVGVDEEDAGDESAELL